MESSFQQPLLADFRKGTDAVSDMGGKLLAGSQQICQRIRALSRQQLAHQLSDIPRHCILSIE